MSEKILFDNGWKIYIGDLAPHKNTDGWGGAKARAYSFGATAFDLNDEKWRTVTLPHDFVSEGEYTQNSAETNEMTAIPEMESIDSRHFAAGSLKSGVAWYRKRFTVPKEKEGERVYVRFDGVFRDSTIYLNEYYISRNESGYTGFVCDITDFVNYGGENVIAVRVDATGREGWWYEGGGIYRHVWLEYKNNIAAVADGVFVKATPDLSAKTAKIEITAEIENYNTETKEVAVKTDILTSDGAFIIKTEGMLTIDAYETARYTGFVEIDNITLWDLNNPYLYKARVRVYEGSTELDANTVTFGIRETRFDADQGFYLNGKSIKIKGLCLHHDHAGVGIGIPDSVNEYRIKQIMRMGANAVRISHYPASPVLLDICDRLGVLVFEEQRRMSSAPDDLENLKAMVKRDRNHPSIFLWGIGNEEIFAQDRPEMARATVTMKMAVRKLDPTRPITSAVVCWNGKERFDNAANYVNITKNLDVMGFNYCRSAWDDYHERMPRQPVIITEASSNSFTRGASKTDESRGQYFIYDEDNITKVKSGKKAVKKDIAENEWKYFAEREYLSGIFLWTGIDYRGEPTPLAYPAVYSQFGILDYCAFAKDNFYYYKSWWTDEPVLHIFKGENSDGTINVYCYTNMPETELFINGKSIGRKCVEKNWYLVWEHIAYETGEITARGLKDGKAITDTIKPPETPADILIEPYNKPICKGDAVIINIKITDKNGEIVANADNELRFNVEGGTILGTGNGNPADHANEKLPNRRAFGGLCQLIVRADGENNIRVTVSSDTINNGKNTECVILYE